MTFVSLHFSTPPYDVTIVYGILVKNNRRNFIIAPLKYIGSLEQEIRQAIIKRNALMPGTSKKRLAAKKAKENMLKRSGDRLPSEEGSEAEGIGPGVELLEEDVDVVADEG